MGDMAWHGGGGTAWQTAKAEAWPPSEAFGFGFESLGESEKHATHLDGGCTRHNNMTQLAPWRARSSKK